MKKIVLIPLALVVGLASCSKQKEELSVLAPTKASTVNHSSAKLKVDFNYTLYKDPTSGDYSCPTPKVDCSKITPDASFSFSAIDAAIASGPSAVLTFFNTSGWQNDYPFLEGETAIIDDLQDGVTTLVRTTDSHDNVFYFVVPYANADDYDTEDIVFTNMVVPE